MAVKGLTREWWEGFWATVVGLLLLAGAIYIGVTLQNGWIDRRVERGIRHRLGGSP